MVEDICSMESGIKLRVLHITNMYPNAKQPHFGSFVKTQIDSLKSTSSEFDIEVFVIGGRGP